MPDPFDALFTVAEVGIALAGFSGVVAMLGRRGAGEWSEPDWLRFAMLLAFSFGVVVFSFLPALAMAFGASEPQAWATSSLLLALFMLAAYAIVIRRVARLGSEATEQFPQATGRAVGILTLPVLATLVLNSLGIGFAKSFAPFLLGLLWLVCLSGFQFYRLLRLR